MSFRTYHNYGYGICLDDFTVVDDVKKIKEFLSYAPEYKKEIEGLLAERGIEEPTVLDYEELDDDYGLGFSSIIKEVLEEYSGIRFLACDDFDCIKYVIYEPSYPWQMSENEKKMTMDDLKEIYSLLKFIFKDYNENKLDYQEVENGG